ncbi:unnamed protein product [Adineta steineri]|uniref:Uncharacterized protein n=1 Tax=Adineta steineri TaxID=433720 RepID=A0A814WV15_9BILA|nr:unnamed protein product [Adineta steineri]CAF1206592.1 unnamed protein product [Adineta steineri]
MANRFAAQTEQRGMNTVKTTATHNASRDDAHGSNVGASHLSAIAATAAATTVPQRRPSQESIPPNMLRRLSMSGGRKSSMFLPSGQPRPNTYRMEPDTEYRFRPYKLQSKIYEVLVEQMKDQKYNPATVNDLVKNVSRSVHQLMKNFQLPRYKLIMQTAISQKYDQLVRIASRCLWDPKTDNMLSVNYETKDMIAIVTVYAVYCE